ncbi:hypothetical protein NGA_2053820, partial [Nannochloropsis gaditana CCMP526]|uniref:uncharacterized protein n=1 Tax=Nannochloropsis gaditana (strain CCMP526) TaxID=1093141 RepID=UPI00029F56F8
ATASASAGAVASTTATSTPFSAPAPLPASTPALMASTPLPLSRPTLPSIPPSTPASAPLPRLLFPLWASTPTSIPAFFPPSLPVVARFLLLGLFFHLPPVAPSPRDGGRCPEWTVDGHLKGPHPPPRLRVAHQKAEDAPPVKESLRRVPFPQEAEAWVLAFCHLQSFLQGPAVLGNIPGGPRDQKLHVFILRKKHREDDIPWPRFLLLLFPFLPPTWLPFGRSGSGAAVPPTTPPSTLILPVIQ